MRDPQPRTRQHLAEMAKEESERLAGVARGEASGAVSRSATLIARRLIEAGHERPKRGMEQPSGLAAAMRRLRGDPDLTLALDEDFALARTNVSTHIMECLTTGYETHILGRAHLMSSQHPELFADGEVTEEDERALRGFPVRHEGGLHTPGEITERLVSVLTYEVEGHLAEPLIGAADLARLPERVAGAERRHAERVYRSCLDAYLAGGQAADREERRALRLLSRAAHEREQREARRRDGSSGGGA